jgi:hypothetical protein
MTTQTNQAPTNPEAGTGTGTGTEQAKQPRGIQVKLPDGQETPS